MRTSLTTPPQLVAGFATFFAAMQMENEPSPFEPNRLPVLECLKSLDDLDEETDNDDDDELEEDEDEDDDDSLDEDDDLDEDYDEDDDDDEDEDEDDEEDDEDEEEDGGVKPLKMSPGLLV